MFVYSYEQCIRQNLYFFEIFYLNIFLWMRGKRKIRRGRKEKKRRGRRGEINKKRKKEEKEEEKKKGIILFFSSSLLYSFLLLLFFFFFFFFDLLLYSFSSSPLFISSLFSYVLSGLSSSIYPSPDNFNTRGGRYTPSR